MNRVFLAALIAILAGCATTQPDKPAIRLEFRHASLSPAPGLLEMTVLGTTHKVYVSGEAVLTNDDVSRVRLKKAPYAPQIVLAFTPEGSRKLAAITEDSIAKPIAILISGRLISAPIVRERINSGQAMITGNFTEDEARRMVDGLTAK